MKIKSSMLSFIVFLFVLTVSNSCDSPSVSVKLLPELTTNVTTLITQNTAISGGNISTDNGFAVTACGVCWSLKPNPTIKDSLTNDLIGTGMFTSSIKNLIPDTTYYVRAYATNKDGSAYGLQETFRTLPIILPVITTTAVSNITATTAISGGNVTSDGGSVIIDRGVCWSTLPKPTINNNKIQEGSQTGIIASILTNLSGICYVRAYASNSAGTSYGNQLVFAVVGPNSTVIDLDGNVYPAVAIGTQVWMAENLKTTKYRNGASIFNAKDNTAWTTVGSGAWCDFNFDATYGTKYGHFYNWYAVKDARNIAPLGWHVASDVEWSTLSHYVNDNLGNSGSVAKALATTTDWAADLGNYTIGNNLSLNNSSGFSALPGGYRYDGGNDFGKGVFAGLGRLGYWWTATENYPSYAEFFYLSYKDNVMYLNVDTESSGYSVRCVRDN